MRAQAAGPPSSPLLDRAILIAVVLAAWQALSWTLGTFALPGPVATVTALAERFGEAAFWADIGATGGALGLAFLIALILGLALGLWFGIGRLAGAVGEPMLASFYALPKLTFYPLVLLIFGLGLWAKVAFGALHGFVPICLFTVGALRTVPPIYLRAARSMGLGRRQVALSVLLPASLPEILTGVRIGAGLTILGTLVGELFAARAGLGHLLRQAMTRADSLTIMAVTLLVFLAAIAINAGLSALSRPLIRWAARG